MTQQWKPFAQRIVELAFGKSSAVKKLRRINRPFYKRLPLAIPKLRLSHQLLGFFVIVVLFPLLLLSLSIYSINQKAVKKQVRQFTEHTAEAVYEELRLEMKWQQEQAQLAGVYWGTLLSGLPVSSEERAVRIRQFFTTYKEYEAVAFYDPLGQQIEQFRSPHTAVFPGNLPPVLKEMPTRVDFRLTHQPTPKQSRKTDTMDYALQVLVPGSTIGADNAVGAVLFIKRFPFLGGLIRDKAKTFENGFLITDNAGIIIAGPSNRVSQKLPPEDFYLYQSLKPGVIQEFSVQAPTSATANHTGEDADSATLEKVFIKVPNPAWGIVIESPYRVQQKYIMRARAQSVGLVFLCILLIVILGLLYSRGINRNFRQLTKGIKALAEGRYSRKIRLITKSWTPYEIVFLTAEFNRMANKISSAWTSIQKLNQELVYKNQQDLFIAQATQRLHSSLELETVCSTAVEIISEHQGIRGAVLYLQSESGKLDLAAKSTRLLPKEMVECNLDSQCEAFLLEALQFRQSLTLSKAQLSTIPAETKATIQPIFYQDSPLGVLVLLREKNPASQGLSFDDDGMILNLISSQIGVAIHQARQWKQLQRANIQLAELDELKSNLIDTVSHELRTPLTNIKGYTSRLIRYEGSLDSQTKIKSLKVIKQQADRLSRLVEDLLVIPDLERAEGIRVFPDRVNLRDLVHRCVTFMHEKANRDIYILQLPADLDILVDPDRMEQVMLNLLDNAIKYSLEGSDIEVKAFQASPCTARIEVFNQCDPIPAEALSMLFSKFKRLDERLTRTTRGTGLGLFITRGLVEAMGGSIWLDGDAGFRVTVEVPLCDAPPVTDPFFDYNREHEKTVVEG